MKQCLSQSFNPVTRHSGDRPIVKSLVSASGTSTLTFQVDVFTCYALRKWWLLQLCLIGCHCQKVKRELPSENLCKCLLFTLSPGVPSLPKEATHKGRYRRGCWMPEGMDWLHETVAHKKAKREIGEGEIWSACDTKYSIVMSKEVTKRGISLAWAAVPVQTTWLSKDKDTERAATGTVPSWHFGTAGLWKQLWVLLVYP